MLRHYLQKSRSLQRGLRLLSAESGEGQENTGQPSDTSADYYDHEAFSQLSRLFLGKPSSQPSPPPDLREPKPHQTSEDVRQEVAAPLNLPPVVMPEIVGESDADREIRAHNSSLYNLKGQVIIGRVVAVGKKDVLVDLGWKDYQTFFKSELSLSQIYKGKAGSEEKDREHHARDFQPGDELQFRIEEVGTPHGEIFVSTQKMRADIRRQLVWEELWAAYQQDAPVMGRVLNPCNAGYAIGVAGFVAFCPLHRISIQTERQIGVLQPFSIFNMTEKVGVNFVVVDPRVRMLGRPQRFRPQF